MEVRVGGMVWIKIADLAPHQIWNMKEQLTIRPKLTTDIAAAKTPDPIFLYIEDFERGLFAIPRGYYQMVASKGHTEILDVSMERMRNLSTTYRSDGPFVEQAATIKMFEEKAKERPWGGLFLQAGCGWGKCLTEDSLVHTDGGLRRIGDVVPDDLDDESREAGIVVETMNGPKITSHVYGKRSAPCLKMTTSQGYQLSGTYVHPVLVMGAKGLEWKRLSEIRVGDYAVGRMFELSGSPVEWPANKAGVTGSICPEDAYIMGLLTGDGSTCNKSISFHNTDEELISLFVEYFESRGMGVRADRRGDRCPSFHVRKMGRDFLLAMAKLGMSTGRAHEKAVPWSVLEGGRAIASSFLRGLFDADGSVDASTLSVEVTSASEAMLRQCQVLLLGLGVRSSVLRKSGVYKGERVFHWRLTVRRDDVGAFVSHVGFSLRRKHEAAVQICLSMESGDRNPNIYNVPVGHLMRDEMDRILDWRERSSFKNYTRGGSNPSVHQVKRFIKAANLGNSSMWAEFVRDDLFFDRIVAVEDDGERRVCDVSVPDGRNFLGNGLVVHNTIFSLELARRMGLKTMILVHQEFFLDQWRDRILGLMPDARVGVVRQSKCEFEGVDFCIGMLQSISRDDGSKYPESMYRSFGLLISDECFVGNTMIRTLYGTQRICDVSEGDIVLNAAGVGRVEGVFGRMVSIRDMRLIRTSDGYEHLCTRDHPWLTSTGWSDADKMSGSTLLTNRDSIDILLGHGTQNAIDMPHLREARNGSFGEDVLFPRVCGGVEEGKSRNVPVVRIRNGETEAESFLFESLFRELDQVESGSVLRESISICKALAREKSSHKVERLAEDDCLKSHVNGKCEGEGVSVSEEDGPCPADHGRERGRVDCSTKDSDGSPWVGMDPGISGQDSGSKGECSEDSKSLQNRSCSSGNDDCCGGGREISLLHSGARERHEEGFVLGEVRVESVTVPEREDFDRLGVSVDGDTVSVFNMKVSGHPSYVLENGLVVHNCHRTGAGSWSGIMPRFNAAWRLGLTATPRRRDGAENVFFYHVNNVDYVAQTDSQVPKLRVVRTVSELRGISRGEYKVSSDKLNSAQAINQLAADSFRNKTIADEVVMAASKGRKIMVVGERIEQLRSISDMVVDYFFRNPLPFEFSVDYYTGEWFSGEIQEKSTKKLRRGEEKMAKRTREQLAIAERANVIFATKQMVSEGLDIQSLDVLVLATPWGDVEQAVGRVRRWCEAEPKKCERLCPWRAGKCARKPVPIVVDILDELVPVMVSKYRKRMAYYRQIGTLKRGEKI